MFIREISSEFVDRSLSNRDHTIHEFIRNLTKGHEMKELLIDFSEPEKYSADPHFERSPHGSMNLQATP